MSGNTNPFVASGAPTVSTLANYSKLGYTTTLPISGGTTWTYLSLATSIDFSLSTSEVDITTLANVFKNYAPGIPEGTASCSVFVAGADAGFGELTSLTGSSLTVGWQVLLKDGSQWTFTGFLTNYALSGVEVESAPVLDIDIRMTSAPTFTAPTS